MEEDLYIRHEFPACLTREGGTEEVFVSIRYHQYDPSLLDITVHLLGSKEQKEDSSTRFRNHKWNFFCLYHPHEPSKSVGVLGITGMTYSPQSVFPRASAVQIDISDAALTEERKYHVTAQLTPSGILIKPRTVEIDFTGEIRNRVIEAGEIAIQTEIGSMRAEETYESHYQIEHSNRVTSLVQRATVFGEVMVPAGTSLLDCHEKLSSILDDICDILSLCCRVPVTYYEVAYLHLEPTQRGFPEYPVLRRKLKPHVRNEHSNELINFRDLRNGGLDQLYKSFRSNPQVEGLRRAIRFLAGSYEEEGLEQSYFLAYVALEAAIGVAVGPGGQYALGPSPFNRLCSRIREVVTNFASENNLPTIADLINEKLPELRRISTRNKLHRLRQELRIVVDDLWDRTDFDEGFIRASLNRDKLVHAATAEKTNELYYDLVRIRILTERILLRLLGWPDEKIWRWHDQDLKQVNLWEVADKTSPPDNILKKEL